MSKAWREYNFFFLRNGFRLCCSVVKSLFMLTIGFFFAVVFVCYIFKFLLKEQTEERYQIVEMAEQEQARCSSSESDNFEKIDSEEAKDENSANPTFIVGDESDPGIDSEPAHEGRDSFPNAPPPHIRRHHLTTAQQLALAEKRSKLRFVHNYKRFNVH